MDKNNHKRYVYYLATVMASNIVDFDDSDEESGDKGEEVIIALLTKAIVRKRARNKVERIPDYIEIIIRKLTDKQFQQHFRLSYEKFEALETLLAPHLKRKDGIVGRNMIDARKQILAVLWILGTPDSYRSVGERFDMGKSSLSVCFMRVICILCKLAPVVINWPSANERVWIEDRYQRLGGLPNVIGAIDGTFINIKAPKENPEVYVTRKCNYSETLQAICIPSLKFVDAFVGYPGSVSDNRIFHNSPIYENVQRDKNTFISGEQYIIGDKAYPIIDWCIPPFVNRGNNMTPSRTYFNQQHAKTRQCIERTFALLFGRWRRLKYLDMNRTDLIPTTVLAACILHNLCLSPELDQDFIAEGLLHLEQHEGNLPEDEDQEVNNLPFVAQVNGTQKRELLCNQLYLQRRIQ